MKSRVIALACALSATILPATADTAYFGEACTESFATQWVPPKRIAEPAWVWSDGKGNVGVTRWSDIPDDCKPKGDIDLVPQHPIYEDHFMLDSVPTPDSPYQLVGFTQVVEVDLPVEKKTNWQKVKGAAKATAKYTWNVVVPATCKVAGFIGSVAQIVTAAKRD